jgi:hypothetical protein
LLQKEPVNITLTYTAENHTGGVYLENKDLQSIQAKEQITNIIKEQK